jgi:hypothetical protein
MRTTKKNTPAVAGLALCALLAGGNASAAIQTFSGTHVSYSFDDAALGLFGPLSGVSVAGDSLVFAPTGFLANSITPAAIGTLNVTVTANAGYQLSGFSLSENGGYSTALGGLAYVTGSLTAIDIEGGSTLNAFGSLAPVYNGTTWTAQTGAVQVGAGWGGLDGVVGSVNLTLSNQLFATGGASIWKTGVQLGAVAAPIPEADTYALMLAGLGLVGVMARRRRLMR